MMKDFEYKPLDPSQRSQLPTVTQVNNFEAIKENLKEELILPTEPNESKGDKKPLDVQVGGGHYKDFAIQPIEYCMKNNLNYCQSNVVKYVTRYKLKNGLQDLKKAIHNIEILIQMEYGNEALVDK